MGCQNILLDPSDDLSSEILQTEIDEIGTASNYKKVSQQVVLGDAKQ